MNVTFPDVTLTTTNFTSDATHAFNIFVKRKNSEKIYMNRSTESTLLGNYLKRDGREFVSGVDKIFADKKKAKSSSYRFS